MQTATLIKDNLPGFVGKASLYRLSEELDGHEYVIVSAVYDAFTHETYIFPANEDGGIEDWRELRGSYRNGTSHKCALSRAGYTLVRQVQ